ncbi:MAG: cytochrome c [Alphaproteobacteria bacterium]|nr:cytochrome c [Alphaproteobacteria bacterium]
MRRTALACLLSLPLLGMGIAWSDSDRQSYDEIEHGRYLADLGDCAGCHTEPGGKPYAGGLPLATPFGKIVSPNITPDRETGIGAWSDDDFVNALLDGRGDHGKRLYPAMPYPYYTRMSRKEALAIRAYLNTLEPVHHEVVSNQLPFPFNIRTGLLAWDWLFFTPGRFEPVAGQSPEWNRGAFLVEGPGHCGACHTTKNFLGGDETSHALQGGVLQGWFAPNLTGDPRLGLGSWSVEDIVDYLKTGHNRITAATGPMSEVVVDSTSHLHDDDLRAIAVYLKSLPQGTEPPTPVAESDPAMRAGAAIFTDQCAACHVRSGEGIASLFPALKGSPAVQAADATNLIRIVLQGARSVATDAAPTAPGMPAFDWKLSDAQVAAVLTYIRNSWGNAAAAVSAGAVKRQRSDLAKTE